MKAKMPGLLFRLSLRNLDLHHIVIHEIVVANGHILFFYHGKSHLFIELARLVVAVDIETQYCCSFRLYGFEDVLQKSPAQALSLVPRQNIELMELVNPGLSRNAPRREAPRSYAP